MRVLLLSPQKKKKTILCRCFVGFLQSQPFLFSLGKAVPVQVWTFSTHFAVFSSLSVPPVGSHLWSWCLLEEFGCWKFALLRSPAKKITKTPRISPGWKMTEHHLPKKWENVRMESTRLLLLPCCKRRKKNTTSIGAAKDLFYFFSSLNSITKILQSVLLLILSTCTCAAVANTLKKKNKKYELMLLGKPLIPALMFFNHRRRFGKKNNKKINKKWFISSKRISDSAWRRGERRRQSSFLGCSLCLSWFLKCGLQHLQLWGVQMPPLCIWIWSKH